MHGIIGVFIGLILFHGWKWILGKAAGLTISMIWLVTTLFFALSTLAPLFPIEIFKGMSCTTGTFTFLAVVLLPFFLAKAGIQSSTNSKGKGWVGGILAMLMTTSFLGVWFISSALNSGKQPDQLHENYEQEVMPPPPPPVKVEKSVKHKRQQSEAQKPKDEQSQDQKPAD